MNILKKYLKPKKQGGVVQVSGPYEIRSQLDLVKDFTLCRESKLASLIQLARDVERRGISGDFVECGCFKGGAAALVSYNLSPEKKVWLYDSFEGMPKTSEKDGTEAPQWVGECVASVADVEEVFRRVGIDGARLTIRKGWFQDTFNSPSASSISFLHVDADWYNSVALSLETFYDRVVEGGLIVLDDFGHWEGCREAFYDFCQLRGIRPLLDRFENDQAFWIKGRMHNRDGWVHRAQLP
jgi:O-methyltransferase